MLAVGDRLPEFALQDIARARVTRADVEGGPGILAFYPKAFSAG